MFKNKIVKSVAKAAFLTTPVTNRGLIHCCFTAIGKDYSMGDLIIYGGDGFYYYKPNGDRANIKNMQQVSDLVYGNTPYLTMAT